MEGIFVGKLDQTVFNPRCISLSFRTKHLDQHVEVRKELDYDCDYVLVKADDVIKTNDELLKLRDEMERLIKECGDWKVRYSKVNNELFQKGLAYGTLETTYKNEKIAGEMLLKDRDALKERVDKLEAELTEIKTARTLREAYVKGVEQGCESLREERDRWKSRWNSVVTDIGESLKANGITFVLKEIHGDGNWDVVIDIPELTEAKAKVADLEKKLAAAKSNETFWRGRKEEMESYHHYWLNTFDRAVKLAAEKGIRIGVRGNDDECNAGIVTLDNMKAEELEKQIVALEKTNKNLNQKIGAADNALEYWNNTYKDIVAAGKKVGVKIEIEGRKSDTNAGFVYVANEKVEELQKRGDYWKGQYDDLAEYWDNTYKEIVYIGEKVGVKIKFEGDMPDNNTGKVHVTNEKALGLAYELNNIKQKHDKKWSAMNEALKEKGVEVIYMGEEDNKPIIDIKVPEWEQDKQWVRTFAKRVTDLLADKFGLESELEKAKNQIDILRKDYVVRGQTIDDLKREIENLKSKKVATCTLEADANGRLKFIYTYMDGHNESAPINGAIDAESLSHGTVPKCKSCAHYMHNPSRFTHDWCYMPLPKEGGAGYIRMLSKDEAEGPACSDFKARKE